MSMYIPNLERPPAAGGGAGDGIAATLLDAKGDLIAASAADTAARLAVGATNGMVLKVASGEATGLKWELPVGHEFDYVERTTDLVISATTAAGANTFITGGSVAYDGATRICIEVYVATMTGSTFADLMLWDGATDLGAMAESQGGASQGQTILARRFLTPSAASHQYIIKAYRNASGTAFAGSGGTAGQYLPAYLRITKA